MKKLTVILAAVLALLSLSGCMDLITGRGNREPDYELPKLSRDMIYAPEDEPMSLTDAFADAGLTLPQGVGFIDYDSGEYILSLERYENAGDRPIEATVYFFDGEEETSSVNIVFTIYDASAAAMEAEHEDSRRDGNVVCYPGEERPLTKTQRLEEAADSIGESTFYHRVYVGWSRENMPEGAPEGPASNAAIALMMAIADRYGVVAPLVILILILTVLYFALYRPYKRHLLNTYGFNLLGWPALFTCFCYFLVFALSAFSIIDDPFSAIDTGMSNMQRIGLILAIGAPGMLWQTINCYIRTRRLSVTIFNIIVMYVACFSIGYVFAVLFIIYIVLKILGLFNKKNKYKCSNCGAIVTEIGGNCPGCGARLV